MEAVLVKGNQIEIKVGDEIVQRKLPDFYTFTTGSLELDDLLRIHNIISISPKFPPITVKYGICNFIVTKNSIEFSILDGAPTFIPYDTAFKIISDRIATYEHLKFPFNHEDDNIQLVLYRSGKTITQMLSVKKVQQTFFSTIKNEEICRINFDELIKIYNDRVNNFNIYSILKPINERVIAYTSNDAIDQYLQIGDKTYNLIGNFRYLNSYIAHGSLPNDSMSVNSVFMKMS